MTLDWKLLRRAWYVLILAGSVAVTDRLCRPLAPDPLLPRVAPRFSRRLDSYPTAEAAWWLLLALFEVPFWVWLSWWSCRFFLFCQWHPFHGRIDYHLR